MVHNIKAVTKSNFSKKKMNPQILLQDCLSYVKENFC